MTPKQRPAGKGTWAIATTSESGTTLFEVLLYIALFSIIFTISSLSFFSIVRHVDRVQVERQKTELGFMIYEVLRHNFDSSGLSYEPSVSDFSNIIRRYPGFALSDMTTSVESDDRLGIEVARVQYKLSHSGTRPSENSNSSAHGDSDSTANTELLSIYLP